MTARTPKPKKSPAPLRGIAATAVEPEFKLTPAEMRLIQAYRLIEDTAQEFILDVSIAFSENDEHRRHKQPALRLVSGVKSWA